MILLEIEELSENAVILLKQLQMRHIGFAKTENRLGLLILTLNQSFAQARARMLNTSQIHLSGDLEWTNQKCFHYFNSTQLEKILSWVAKYSSLPGSYIQKTSGVEIECHCGKTDMRLKGCVRCSREHTRIMP